MLTPDASPEVYFRLLALYGACLALGFGVKRLARGAGLDASARAAAPAKGPGIGRKFKVFFAFQALLLTLAFWSLPGLGVFLAILLAGSALEIADLKRTAGERPGYPFRPLPALGLLALFAASALCLLAWPGLAQAGLSGAGPIDAGLPAEGFAGAGASGAPAGYWLARGAPALAFAFLLVAVCDGFSQIGGEILGGSKLVPTLSPGKTWSGFLTGLTACALASAAGQAVVYPWLHLPAALAAGVGIGLAAFLGDISASWVKRRLGVKDFSRRLGPQGGVLDRADSLIWLGPFLVAATLLLPGLAPRLSQP